MDVALTALLHLYLPKGQGVVLELGEVVLEAGVPDLRATRGAGPPRDAGGRGSTRPRHRGASRPPRRRGGEGRPRGRGAGRFYGGRAVAVPST